MGSSVKWRMVLRMNGPLSPCPRMLAESIFRTSANASTAHQRVRLGIVLFQFAWLVWKYDFPRAAYTRLVHSSPEVWGFCRVRRLAFDFRYSVALRADDEKLIGSATLPKTHQGKLALGQQLLYDEYRSETNQSLDPQFWKAEETQFEWTERISQGINSFHSKMYVYRGNGSERYFFPISARPGTLTNELSEHMEGILKVGKFPHSYWDLWIIIKGKNSIFGRRCI